MKKKLLKERLSVTQREFESVCNRSNFLEQDNNDLDIKNRNQQKELNSLKDQYFKAAAKANEAENIISKFRSRINDLEEKLVVSEKLHKETEELRARMEKRLHETIIDRNRLADWVDKFRKMGATLKVSLYTWLSFYFKPGFPTSEEMQQQIEKMKETEKETRQYLKVFENQYKEYKIEQLKYRYRWADYKGHSFHQPPVWFNPEENFFYIETKNWYGERVKLNTPSNHTKSLISSLVQALKDDPEYRETWVANIAMAFKDEMNKSESVMLLDKGKQELHRITNAAANNFLDLLIKE